MSSASLSRVVRKVDVISKTNEANFILLVEEVDMVKALVSGLMSISSQVEAKFVPMKKVKEALINLINYSAKVLAAKPPGNTNH